LVQINGGGGKVKNEEGSPERHQIFSGNQEIFVMRRNLFWSNKIIEKFSSFNGRKIDGVMFHIEWVNKSLDFGFIDFLLNAGFKFIDFRLKQFDIFVISFSKFQEI
jgi:hypothetical protein